jgi:hypothetical protein
MSAVHGQTNGQLAVAISNRVTTKDLITGKDLMRFYERPSYGACADCESPSV